MAVVPLVSIDCVRGNRFQYFRGGADKSSCLRSVAALKTIQCELCDEPERRKQNDSKMVCEWSFLLQEAAFCRNGQLITGLKWEMNKQFTRIYITDRRLRAIRQALAR